MNDLPDGIKTIRVTENRLNMPQVTTETDVASLKNHLAGEPLGHETTLAQKRVEPVVPQSTEQDGISTNHALISISIRC